MNYLHLVQNTSSAILLNRKKPICVPQPRYIKYSLNTRQKSKYKSCQGSNKVPISQDPVKNMIAILVTVKMRQCGLTYPTYISNKEKNCVIVPEG